MMRNLVINGNPNKLQPADRPVHEWYRFVLSFPPHLVRDYLARFAIDETRRVLDPFCGTGTTLVECRKRGVSCVGIEANPMAYYASRVKLDWRPDPAKLRRHARKVADDVLRHFNTQGIDDSTPCSWDAIPSPRTLSAEQMKLILTDSISPVPLHKTLVLLERIEENKHDDFYHHERLALARAIVATIGNLHFGPEVGVGPVKSDVPTVAAWMNCIEDMVRDLRGLKTLAPASALVHHADSRHLTDWVEPESIDAVITSPPYPNEKDYTRTTRLESVLLGFIQTKADLRNLKQGLIRSNTRNVYVADQDDQWVDDHSEIQSLAEQIEARRIHLGKTSGFERLYARVTKLYFGGMARHLAQLRTFLRPGAQLAYVVGDQASYLRVMIRTGTILADMARAFGYEVVGLDLFRTRRATATREELREEVLVLRWPRKKILPFSSWRDGNTKAVENRKTMVHQEAIRRTKMGFMNPAVEWA